MEATNKKPGGKARRLPINYDPYLRFIAAYAALAATDYFWPPKNLEYEHRQSAVEFMHSEDGQFIIEYIVQSKIRQSVNGGVKC